MSTTTIDGRVPLPIATGPLRHFIARHSVGLYFALTVVISWTAAAMLLGPSSFPLSWERFEKLGGDMYAVFLAGPVVAGLTMIGVVHGRSGYRDLFARLRTWRVGWRVYAMALLPAIVLVLVAVVLGFASERFAPAIFTSDDKASTVLLGVAVSLLFGFFEELGWTGFATPKLLQRHSAAGTGLIIGLVWGAWHFPLFWKADSFSEPLAFAILMVQLFSWLPGFRILMVCMYERTGSLLVPMLMHASLVTTQLVFLPRALSPSASLFHLGIWAATIWLVLAVFGWTGWTRRSSSVGD